MKKFTAVLWSGFFLIALLASASAQPAPDSFDKDAFLSRKKWYLSFTLRLKGRGEVTKSDAWGGHSTTHWTIDREVSGDVVLDFIAPGDGPIDVMTKVLPGHAARAGRFITWSPRNERANTVTYRINDSMRNEVFGHGEGWVETSQSEFKITEGAGTLPFKYSKAALACDVDDKLYDVHLEGLRNGLGGSSEEPRTIKITGERRSGKVTETVPPETDKAGICLPTGNDLLWKALFGRKLELHDGKIEFTVSAPTTELPRPYSGSGVFNGGKTEGGPPLELSLEISLSPTPPSRAKLILKPEDAYTSGDVRWRPLCSDSEDKPGNHLQVEWRVEEEGGDPSKPTKVKQVVFLLKNTSKEPGVCMNYPLVPKSPADFDLKFKALANPLVPAFVAPDGQKFTLYDAQVSAGKGSITIDCFDSGATGVLVAEAELEDGRLIEAVIEKTGESELRIPDYEPGVSWIERSWRAKNAPGKKDEADDEDDPVGDGQKGDGLTVWEEYRGFWVGGQWEGGDPKKKDLFIVNAIGGVADAGIWKFGEITQLSLHPRLAYEEVKADRVINFNKSVRPHLVDQHCLVLKEGGDVRSGLSLCRAMGGVSFPGPPKNTSVVEILADVLTRTKPEPQVRSGETYNVAEADMTICHELGHAIGLRHHGDKDHDEHTFMFLPKQDGQVITTVDGVETKVLDENTGLGVDWAGLYPWMSVGDITIGIIGERNGQHSGDEGCVMRYDVARAYRSQSDSTVLYWHRTPEIIGTRLCTSPAGTGVNMPTHEPQSRYFGADKDRGDCVHKFVISDHWEKIH